MKKLALVAIVALLPLASAGCGANCVAMCETANNECPGAYTDDCDDNCSKAEALADAAGCRSEYDDAVDCKSDLDNLCEDAGCFSDYTRCVAPYCLTHVQECQDAT